VFSVQFYLISFKFSILLNEEEKKADTGADRKASHDRLDNAARIGDEKRLSGRFRRSSSHITQHNYPYVLDKKIYLELLVVVDKKMKDYYGENLENHIQTLMFLVKLKILKF